ncbi:hypothetical protein N2152v2_004637 [Parachlorella kessleri]
MAVPAGPAVDWEEFLYEAVQQLGLDPGQLEDYGIATGTQCMWQGRMGLLAVALLQLRGQQQGGQPLSCVLIHVAACTEATAPINRVAAFAAEWLRGRLAEPSSREQLPYVLTNVSVLREGRSLQYIAHPWLPQCILGYRQ